MAAFRIFDIEISTSKSFSSPFSGPSHFSGRIFGVFENQLKGVKIVYP